jgi:trigger factor
VAVTKEIIRLEKSNVRLNLTVSKDEVLSRYQNLINEYTKNAQLPGFRRGKVPREVLERKFGESLKAEALGRIIEAAVTEVFEDQNLSRYEKPLPYSSPQVQDEPKLDFETDLKFSVIYDVLPQVNIGQWKGLEVEAPVVEITEEDLNRELAEVRDRNAIVMDRDDGAAAENGNVVTINYCELGDSGEVLPISERQDFVFTLGTGYNTYKFDDEVAGMKKGETKEFSKTFPADFADSSLAGQTKKLRVTLTALKKKELPELDDDLAQDVDEKFKTLEDLKNSIRERLSQSLKHRLRKLKINALLEKIMENTPVVLPESMIRAELDGRLRNLGQRFNMPPAQIFNLLSKLGDGFVDIENEWRPTAEKALHSRLIVETLIEEQKFEASEHELEQEMEAIAAESGTDFEEFKQYYQDYHGGDMREEIMEELKERKLFDFLLAENTVKTGKKLTYLDLVQNNG